jgi:hypothetical protein
MCEADAGSCPLAACFGFRQNGTSMGFHILDFWMRGRE